MHWTVDPAEPGPYLGRARFLLAAVMLVALAVLPFVVVRAFRVDELLNATSLRVTDDQTWVTAQLEVDFLKFAVAVAGLRSENQKSTAEVAQLDGWPEVVKRFDIFYARVGTVASKIENWSDATETWKTDLGVLEGLLAHRSRIANVLDQAATPDALVDLDALDLSVAATALVVRDLSVTTLSILSEQANDRRLNYVREFRAVLIQILSMVMVMMMTSLAAWVLYRQMGASAAAEHRMNENVQRIVDAKPDAILVTDPNHCILWMNTPANCLFGLSEGQALGRDALQLFFRGVSRRTRRGGTHPLIDRSRTESAMTFRDIVHRSDGRTLAVEVTRIRLVRESGGETTALFIRDISETQRALRALRRERRLAEAEAARYQRFLSVMSHEIRSPLHAIIASLDLAQQRPEASALSDLHEIAMDAAQVALEEADAVLEIGRAEHQMRAAEPVVFSPAQIAQDLVDMTGPAAHSAGTELFLDIGPGVDNSILGLRACFWHAVSNLLSNAVKFARGGKVRLRLTRTEDQLRVEVIDNGPGMSPELQKMVFRDHFTLDSKPGGRGKGAGLGLGVFVAAVAALSGTYGVQSEPGLGSTFWFTFPAPRESRQIKRQTKEKLATASPVPTHLRVLVVDDSHINRTLMQQMFATFGLDPDLASSGVEAVELAQACAYDLILMDLSMPEMDGSTAAALIRQDGASRQAAIVALTANVLARDQREKPDCVFDEVLIKPLRLDGLHDFLAFGLYRPAGEVEDLPPIIDQEIARDLLAMLSPAAIEPHLQSLFNEARDLARDLDQAKPDSALPGRFHRIAGSAGMLGAGRLRALALTADGNDPTHLPTRVFLARWKQTITETSTCWTALLAQAKDFAGTRN